MELNFLEIFGTIVGLIYLWLEYRASIYLWIAGIVMPAFTTIATPINAINRMTKK